MPYFNQDWRTERDNEIASQISQDIKNIQEDVISGNSNLPGNVQQAVVRNMLYDYAVVQRRATRNAVAETKRFAQEASNAVDLDKYTSSLQNYLTTQQQKVNEIKAQADDAKAKQAGAMGGSAFNANLRNAPDSEEVSRLDEAAKQAQAAYDKVKQEFDRATAQKNRRDSERTVNDAAKRGVSFKDQYDAYSQSLDDLNKQKAQLTEQLSKIRNGSSYYGAASTYEQDKARQEADEKEATDRLEKLEQEIARLEGTRAYARQYLTKDAGAEAVIRQGEELARTAKEQGAEIADSNRAIKKITDYISFAPRYGTARNIAEIIGKLFPNSGVIRDITGAIGNLPEAYNPLSFIAELGIRAGENTPKTPNNNWSQDQLDLYHFFYGNPDYGKEAAEKYAQMVNYAMNTASVNAQTKSDYAVGASKNNGFLKTVGGLVGAVPDMALAAGDAQNKLLDILATGTYAGHDTATAHERFSAFSQGRADTLNSKTLSESIPVIGGKGWGDLYQLGQSALQSISSGHILGEAATLGAFFVNAANSAFDEAMQRTGGNTRYAATFSLLSGAAEVIGEKVSLDHLLKGGKVGSLSFLLKQAGIEGSEEVGTSLLNQFFDSVAAKLTGEQASTQSKIAALVRSGMSYADAEKQVWKQAVNDLAWDFAGGAISGGLSGGAYAAPNALYNYVQNRNSRNQQKTQTAQPAQPTQAEANQRPTTRNPLYEALNPQTPAAETAQKAAGVQEAPKGQVTQPTAEATQETAGTAQESQEGAQTAEQTPAEAPAPETTKSNVQRFQEIQKRLEEINNALNENPDEETASSLYEEGEALYQESRQLESLPEVIQQKRVDAGEVSKGFGTVENHIDNRTDKDLSKPSVKAFQFDYPELHQYFVDVAQELIADVEYAEKLTKANMYELGSAVESGPVRQLMDMGLTKPEIIKALQDIIANNGQENYAKAKKVERVLSEMMTDGWRDLKNQNHDAVPDYIAAKDSINGAVKSDSWEKYLADHETVLALGEVTEEQLRAEWEQMHPQEEAAAVTESEPAPEASQPVETASAAPEPAPQPGTEGTQSEQSAGTIPASEQTTAERTNGTGNERERNMSRNLRGNEKAEPDLRNSFEENRDLYTQLTNAEVAAKAAEIIGKGYDAAKNDIYEKIGQAKAGAKLAPEYAVAGYQLANEMVRRGEVEAARELCADIAAELTYAGQVGQIGRLILESDPSIRIKTVDKIVDKINDSMTDRQKAKNKKRSNGKESARKANEAAQAAQKQAADMVANSLSGGDTFNFPDAAAKEVAGSIKAQIKRALSPQKPRNALDTFVGYVKKFAREKINVGEKSKPMTSTEFLREVVNNEELFMEVYEKAQAEFMGEDATGYREFVEDYVNTPVGIDGTGDARNKLFMQAIVESATATSENAKTIRTQAALGVPKGEIANRIADALIEQTGATGGIADSIRGSAQAYVNEIINSDEKTGDARAEREVASIMQAIGAKFREMAVQNKAAKDAVRRDIANMLATEYALSPDSAEKIAQSVANEYDRQLSDAMAKEVEKRFAPKEKRAKAEAKALTQQLTEAINLGTFSSDYATEAVNKIFGVDGNISVSDEALQRYAAAETKEEQNEALNAIEQEIADQIPATFRDKFTALRYLNMLGNLKTQGRNIVGNAAMMTATNIKYLTQHVGELAASLVTGGEYQGNTALNTSKELRQQAAEDFEAHADEIKGESKYSDVGRQAAKSIQKKRQIFGTTGNALWDNTVGRGLEWARNRTTDAMEIGDEIFLRQVYVRSFAGWMKAHGITDVNSASAEQVSAAREFAKKEAQEATFHDSNKVSDWVSSLGRGPNTPEAVKMISEGVVPFRRTPANVAVRAVEYSPVGAFGTIYKAIQAKKGNASAADVINSAAKNLTGTALFGIGMLLAAAGRARASGDDEDKKLNEFEKLKGEMDYSIKVGDKYISLSQLAPMAIPFFMGVKLNELLEYSDNLFSADSIGDILGVVSEPMLEMSMLSGVNDFLNDLSSLNGDTDALPSLVGNAALSYLSQGLTNSLLGQLEQASERNRQTTYSDTKSKAATAFDRFLGKNQYKIGKYSAKIPGIDYNQQDYVDAWGRTQSNGGAGERAFNAFLNPTYTGKDRSTDVDEELERLYRDNKGKDGFPNVFPQKRSRSDVIGDGVVMTPDEYLSFSKESGQKKLELVREFIQSSDYKDLTDEQRAETIHNLYAFADATALQKVRDANGVMVENKYAKISDLSDVPAYLAATERFKAEAAKEGKEFNGWTNTNFEKYVSAGLKAEDLDVLAESALSDARKPAYDLMREVGMSPKEYMDAIAVMDGEKHDGQFKQADVYNWLVKNTTMSTEQKNQLWDMLGNNWKTSFSNYKPK